jgi:hypothetical protein
MKYGCQQGICFSPIDPCIFVEFFLIILCRFPRNVHTNCRNPPARSTTKKRKGRTIDLSYKFFPTRALTFSVKRDEFRFLVAVPCMSSWRFTVYPRARPIASPSSGNDVRPPAASAQTRHAEGGIGGTCWRRRSLSTSGRSAMQGQGHSAILRQKWSAPRDRWGGSATCGSASSIDK